MGQEDITAISSSDGSANGFKLGFDEITEMGFSFDRQRCDFNRSKYEKKKVSPLEV